MYIGGLKSLVMLTMIGPWSSSVYGTSTLTELEKKNKIKVKTASKTPSEMERTADQTGVYI